MCNSCVTSLCSAHSFIQKCIQADKILNDIKQSHKTSVHEVVLSEKEKIAKTSKTVNAKKNIHQPSVSKAVSSKKKIHQPSVCKTCSAEFENRYQLRDHYYKYSKACKPKPHICSLCKFAFESKCRLVGHMRTHTKETPYECKTCSKQFRFLQNLHRHEKVHSNTRPYVCDLCGKGQYLLELC